MTEGMYKRLFEDRDKVEYQIRVVGSIAELDTVKNGIDLIEALTDVVNMAEVTDSGLIGFVRLGFEESENITYGRMSMGESKVEVKGRLWKAKREEFSLSVYVANRGFASNTSYIKFEPKNGVGGQLIFLKENDGGDVPCLSIGANDDFGKDWLYIDCALGDTKVELFTNGEKFSSRLNSY